MGSPVQDAIDGDGETPVREVHVDRYLIATTTVTNADFARFVADTGYRTTAEASGWSFVFVGLATAQARRSGRPSPQLPWWLAVPGATWREPHGPGSSLLERADHPVVHVSWNYAAAYASWAGGRLPSEAEWEKGARAGRRQTRFPWGDELEADGRHHCNVFQGTFPDHDTALDGFAGTAPVRSFPANDIGLHEVIGNVWEWCADRFIERGASGEHQVERVLKGGSYLCHESYCRRYRLGARTRQFEDTTADNVGFRLAANAPAR